MYHQLLEMMQDLEKVDIEKTPNFRAIKMLRNELHALGLDEDFAGEIAIRCNVTLGEYSDEEISALIKPFAAMAYRVVEAFLKNGFSREGTLAGVGKQLTMTCE